MKSDEHIIDIIDQFGSEDNRELRKALKAFRTQIKLEVLSKVKNAISLIKILYR